jgi:GDP-4-dehydro-6-deoxy-D-mannose reductase
VILYDGATGGLGRHLAAAIASAGLEGRALGARLEDGAARRAELAALGAGGALAFVQAAARVSVPACEADPGGALATNAARVAEAVADVAARARALARPLSVVHVGTGHVYAVAPPGTRLREDAPLAPRSAYARSKLAAERALEALARAEGFGLTIARVFGLVAPSQPPQYVLPGLLRRAREGRLDDVPGLDGVRDYLDARDVAAALVKLAVRPPAPGEVVVVNVCSGEGVALRSLLATILAALDRARADEAERASAAPGRPDDVAFLVGDPSRYEARVGAPARSIPLARTVADAVAAP